MIVCKSCNLELAEGTRFCTECGTPTGVIPEKQSAKFNQSRSAIKEVKIAPDPEGYKEKVSSFFKPSSSSTAKVIILYLITFSFYYYRLLYKWVKLINEVSEEQFFSPGAAVLLSIITLGGASVYFEYEIARRAESLIISTGGKAKRVNSIKKPPIGNYKEIVLIVNIVSLGIAWITVGAFFIIPWIAGIWIALLHQNTLEYLIDIDQNSPQ